MTKRGTGRFQNHRRGHSTKGRCGRAGSAERQCTGKQETV
nr:MAG TPA_asm: hypothetical protein [Caudoviricetes sp.]